MARTKGGKKIVSTMWKCSSSLSRPIAKSAKPTEKRKKKTLATNVAEDSAEPPPASSPPSEPPNTSENSASSTAADPAPPETATGVSSDQTPPSPKITNGSVPSSSQPNGTAENNLPISVKTRYLFHKLGYSEDVLSALPNRTWAIHCTEAPLKRIVISALSMYDSQDAGPVPHYVKQIIFDERLNFEILLVNCRITLKGKPSCISTMNEFEDLLDYVDSMKVCKGGPSFSLYSRVTPECAYRDGMNNWRHNLCSLEITNGEVCESCNSLDEILRRHAQRTRTTVKSAGKRKR